jgi:hypothetical protein
MKKVVFRKDTAQTKSLQVAGTVASATAVRHAKALDLDITYIENGNVIVEEPNGHTTVVKKLEKAEAPILLTKGMVLHAK